jgi:hypothetical protein
MSSRYDSLRGRLAVAVLLLMAGPVLAQPAATEHVTVTGTKSREVTDAFVQAFAAPARMTGKLARWEDGVCPVTVGLKPKFTDFISQRVRDVGAQAGAPVNARKSCTPNIEIVFTTAPQALLDNVRKRHAEYLGYADSSAQKAALATVSRPIQAWYTTQTRDLRGQAEFDSPRGGGVDQVIPDPFIPNGFIHLSMPNAHGRSVSGGRLDDGTRSTFYHIIIVADPNRLLDHEIGSLADYIAMLALTQLSSLDSCQQLPSIVNLLAPGCASPGTALTDSDLGYLKGLYHMRADGKLSVQQDEISYQMQRSLEGK